VADDTTTRQSKCLVHPVNPVFAVDVADAAVEGVRRQGRPSDHATAGELLADCTHTHAANSVQKKVDEIVQ